MEFKGIFPFGDGSLSGPFIPVGLFSLFVLLYYFTQTIE